jgi:hypothetical protein
MATVERRETKELLPEDADRGRIGALIERITDDLKSIARDELELGKTELTQRLKLAGIDAGFIILGGVMALISLGFLSVAAVDALAPLIAPLWARLLVMAAVYFAVCGGLLVTFVKRLKAHVTPEMPRTKAEAKRTVEAVKEELRHA